MDYAYMDPEFTLEQLEAKLQDCLLYAVFPGTAPFDNQAKIDRIRPLFRKYLPPMRRLGEAGWEPLTYARAQPTDTPIERYGSGLPGELHFAFKNVADAPASITVHVMPEVLADNSPARLRVTDLMSGEALPLEAEGKGFRFRKKLPAAVTGVVSVTLAE